MVEINGIYLCEGCFKRIEGNGGCDCGVTVNPSGSLEIGSILNGRFVVGKQIRETRTVKEYICYDSRSTCVVLVKEFFPKFFVSRKSGTIVTLEKENNIDAYNSAMQKFIQLMQVPQGLENSDCFIKVQRAFYENNTAYFVVEYHSPLSVKEFVAVNGHVADNTVVFSLYTAIKGLLELERSGAYNGNISANNVYMSIDGIKTDGFEPNEDDFAPYLKESVIFDRTSYYMSASDFAQKGKDIFSDVFSFGAVLYTMLTARYPESPFESKQRFDIAALENATGEKLLVDIIKKMCGMNEEKYESLDSLTGDADALFRKYGLKPLGTYSSYSVTQKVPSDGNKTLKIVIAIIAVIVLVTAAIVFVIIGKNSGGKGFLGSLFAETATDAQLAETATQEITSDIMDEADLGKYVAEAIPGR